MLQTSARLLRLLTLLQARSTWAGADLAARLEVTPRTLRRDVDRLRTLGYPVDSETGAAGGYQLGEGASLPPLSLDEDEATAVFIGLSTAASTGVAGADTASIRALSKLERVLPSRVKKKFAALSSSVLKLADRTPAISLSDVSTLAAACSERRVCSIAYPDREGNFPARDVEPLRLVHTGRSWYLVAWDVKKSDWRTFRVDRIREAIAKDQRFKSRNPPDENLERYVTASLSSSPYKFKARGILHAPIETVRTRMSAYDGALEELDANRCILQTGAHSLDGLAFHFAMVGVEFQILEPVELTLHVKKIGERMTRGATRSAKAEKTSVKHAKRTSHARPRHAKESQ